MLDIQAWKWNDDFNWRNCLRGDDFYATRKSGKGSKMFDAKKSQLEWMGYFVARTRGDDFSHNI